MVTTQASPSPQAEVAFAAPGLGPGVPIARDLIPLRAAFGQDEANHGTQRYPIDGDGLVRVPLEAVGPLISVGGFVFARAAEAAISGGVMKLHHAPSFEGLAKCPSKIIAPTKLPSLLRSSD